jgi:hypothetical protein
VVLLGRKDGAVGEFGDRANQLRECPVLVSVFSVLDEDGVLGDPRGVEDQRDAVGTRQLAYARQVRDRERLSARHVEAGLDADERHALGAAALQTLEGCEVEVP